MERGDGFIQSGLSIGISKRLGPVWEGYLECVEGPKSFRNRSVYQYPTEFHPMVEAAANDMESIMLFQDPLPAPKDTMAILETICRNAELLYGADFQGDAKVDSYVCFAEE